MNIAKLKACGLHQHTDKLGTLEDTSAPFPYLADLPALLPQLPFPSRHLACAACKAENLKESKLGSPCQTLSDQQEDNIWHHIVQYSFSIMNRRLIVTINHVCDVRKFDQKHGSYDPYPPTTFMNMMTTLWPSFFCLPCLFASMYACLDIHHAYFIYNFMTCLISPTLALCFPTGHSAPRAVTGHVLPGFHNRAAEHGHSCDTPEIEDSTKSIGRAMLLSEVVPLKNRVVGDRDLCMPMIERRWAGCIYISCYGYKMHKKVHGTFRFLRSSDWTTVLQ